MKISTVLYASLLVMGLVGCGSSKNSEVTDTQKTDEPSLIQDAFKKAVSGDEAATFVMENEAKKELEHSGLQYGLGYKTSMQIKELEECSVEVREISQDGQWAIYHPFCDKQVFGSGYMKKDKGQWKVTVRK